ncbi:MAG: hypothetical protein WDZ73_01145 [Candidatus Paceibacterota bacterium]
MKYILMGLIIGLVLLGAVYFLIDKEKNLVAQNLDLFKHILLDIEENKIENITTTEDKTTEINLINPVSNQVLGVVTETVTPNKVTYRLTALDIGPEFDTGSVYDVWLRTGSNSTEVVRLGQIDNLGGREVFELTFDILPSEHIYNEFIVSQKTDTDIINNDLIILMGILPTTGATTSNNI